MEPFEQFHAAYPPSKREWGARAHAIFDAALRRASLPTLLAALDAHKRSAQWEIPRYIPLMTTWLLGEHWRQEIGAPTTTPGLSSADQAQRWRSLSPCEQARRLGYK